MDSSGDWKICTELRIISLRSDLLPIKLAVIIQKKARNPSAVRKNLHLSSGRAFFFSFFILSQIY